MPQRHRPTVVPLLAALLDQGLRLASVLARRLWHLTATATRYGLRQHQPAPSLRYSMMRVGLGMLIGVLGAWVVLPRSPVETPYAGLTGDHMHVWPILLQVPLRQDVVFALARMSDEELLQACSDIDLAFENSLRASYLGAARTLIDYAFLAERELALRALERPQAARPAADLLQRFELFL